MPALLDIALAVFVLAGAFLLFGVARQLLTTPPSKDNKDDSTPPTP
jgi:hypothetical protein